MMSKGTKVGQVDFIKAWESQDFATTEEVASFLELTPSYCYQRAVKLQQEGVILRDRNKVIGTGNGKRGPKKMSVEESNALILSLRGGNNE